MIATEYQPLARRTMKELPREKHFIHMALGLTGEIGEFIDAVKKHVVYGKVLDLVNLTEETGDDFWYAVGLLPELGVPPSIMQRAIDKGYTEGTKMCLSERGEDPWELAKLLLELNFGIAAASVTLANQPERFEEGSSDAVKVVESIGTTLGVLCGLFRLDPAVAMDLNIKKLAKRYGDKYSDVAALNRDTAAERIVLEGGAVGHAAEDVLIPTNTAIKAAKDCQDITELADALRYYGITPDDFTDAKDMYDALVIAERGATQRDAAA